MGAAAPILPQSAQFALFRPHSARLIDDGQDGNQTGVDEVSVDQVNAASSRIRATLAAGAVDWAVCAAALFAVIFALAGTLGAQVEARADGVRTGLVSGFSAGAGGNAGAGAAGSVEVREN